MSPAQRARAALAATLLGGASPACTGIDPIEPDEACRNVGYAIASRVHACTGDENAANAANDRFEAAYRCVEQPVTLAHFECAERAGEADCAFVEASGDALDPWLSRSSTCADILEAAQ